MRKAISPRLAISIFSNMVCLRVEIAYAACSRYAIGLRRCTAGRPLVTAISDQYFFKHFRYSKTSDVQLHQRMRLANNKQWLTKFNWLTIFDQNCLDNAGMIRINFIEQLHCFDDAQGITAIYILSDIYKLF